MVIALGAIAAVTVIASAGTAIPVVAAASSGTGAATATTAATSLSISADLAASTVSITAVGGPALLTLGTSQNPNGSDVTYDCWKPVLHDTSREPSNGMLMKDVMSHPSVTKVTVTDGPVPELPHILLENMWNERFEIDYVMFRVDSNIKLACHARQILE